MYNIISPSNSSVDQLLSMGVNVTVYNGQLDLICDTMGEYKYTPSLSLSLLPPHCTPAIFVHLSGTLQWLSTLKWPYLKDFMSSKRVPLYPPSGKAKRSTGAFYQAYKNLQFFWILKAGHMVSIAVGIMLGCSIRIKAHSIEASLLVYIFV